MVRCTASGYRKIYTVTTSPPELISSSFLLSNQSENLRDATVRYSVHFQVTQDPEYFYRFVGRRVSIGRQRTRTFEVTRILSILNYTQRVKCGRVVFHGNPTYLPSNLRTSSKTRTIDFNVYSFAIDIKLQRGDRLFRRRAGTRIRIAMFPSFDFDDAGLRCGVKTRGANFFSPRLEKFEG